MADRSYEKLIFDRRGPIITITLNRPKIHNALDRPLSAALNQAVRRGDPARRAPSTALPSILPRRSSPREAPPRASASR